MVTRMASPMLPRSKIDAQPKVGVKAHCPSMAKYQAEEFADARLDSATAAGA